MSNIGKNDSAWEQLFEKYDILHHVDKDGFFKISASQIKAFREPRLMVKFDHTANLPKLFAKNQLAILPITRGEYIIAHFNAYHRFEENNSNIIRLPLPSYLQSLDPKNIPSETIALNGALASGIIPDFVDDSHMVTTVSGRMGSGSFSFGINDTKYGILRQVNVKDSQIEIDAAFEGITYLAIFEAKMDLSEDFLVRQLYYPFRVWKNRRISKPVKPIFLLYSNGIYRLYEYVFLDEDNYSSIQLVKQQNYSIEDITISSNDIQEVLEKVVITDEPKIPFPQADKFERIINICELALEHISNKTDISGINFDRTYVTEHYDFDVRQTNYYTDGARYLGLLSKDKNSQTPIYQITKKGKKILTLSFRERQLAFCHCILSHKVFNKILKLYFKTGEMPATKNIVKVMKKTGLYNIESDETFTRRASTIKGWLNWIVSLINE